MKPTMNALMALCMAWLALFNGFVAVADFDYKEALTKSLVFLDAQRSGKLPTDFRVSWRGDSGLNDGNLSNVDLVGGYYDAGDNVKYGLPMAFTITTLAWSAIAYDYELRSTGEMENAQDAIRWGTDYFLKASVQENSLWVQVGDPVADHQCWIRPENMNTPRTLCKIDEFQPGTEIAAETAAAMAASYIVFKDTDSVYANELLDRAKQLFEFAQSYKGTYDGECPFYCSASGYNDELLWAAAWLYKATNLDVYSDYVLRYGISASVIEFSWDLKFAGAQILLTELNVISNDSFHDFKSQADFFVCAVLPESPNHQAYITPGGILHIRDGANTQYVTGTALLFSIYGDILENRSQTVSCGNMVFQPTDLHEFAKKQMDYILGNNPRGSSYMVGFGTSPPTQAHHRGSSVPVLSPNYQVDCGMSFVYWYGKDQPNPNELTGAIVGGPDAYDNFTDERSNGPQLEPCTYINSLAVGPLAKLAGQGS